MLSIFYSHWPPLGGLLHTHYFLYTLSPAISTLMLLLGSVAIITTFEISPSVKFHRPDGEVCWVAFSTIFIAWFFCTALFFFHCKSDTFLTYTNGMVALRHLQRVEYCQGWSFLFDFISSLSQSTWNACILNCLLPFSQSHIFLGFIHTSLPLLHVCPAAITKYLRLDMLFWRLQVYLAWNFGAWKSQRHRGGSNVSPPHPTTAVFCSRWHPGVSQWVKERFHWKAGDQRWSNRV